MTDAVRAALTKCSACARSGPTRTVYLDDPPDEKRICRHCWEDSRKIRLRYNYAPIAEWPDPGSDYDPHKGEPGTR